MTAFGFVLFVIYFGIAFIWACASPRGFHFDDGWSKVLTIGWMIGAVLLVSGIARHLWISMP